MLVWSSSRSFVELVVAIIDHPWCRRLFITLVTVGCCVAAGHRACDHHSLLRLFVALVVALVHRACRGAHSSPLLLPLVRPARCHRMLRRRWSSRLSHLSSPSFVAQFVALVVVALVDVGCCAAAGRRTRLSPSSLPSSSLLLVRCVGGCVTVGGCVGDCVTARRRACLSRCRWMLHRRWLSCGQDRAQQMTITQAWQRCRRRRASFSTREGGRRMDVISAMARGARRDGAMARLRVVVSSVLISVHWVAAKIRLNSLEQI